MNQKEIARVLGIDKRVDGYKDEEGKCHFYLDRVVGFTLVEKDHKLFDIEMIAHSDYDWGEPEAEERKEGVTLEEALLAFIKFRRLHRR